MGKQEGRAVNKNQPNTDAGEQIPAVNGPKDSKGRLKKEKKKYT